MIGIIPSTKVTYEVYGSIHDDNLLEGKLYYGDDGRIYYYSKTETRSSPNNGYFPIYNGKRFYVSKHSKLKYLDNDVIKTDIESISSSIDDEKAKNILYMQRRSTNTEILKPQISDEDNMFTQCIKGVICTKDITIVDLIDMGAPILNQTTVENYYSSLIKITFMRYDKWLIWIDKILKLKYIVTIFRDNKECLIYKHSENSFNVDGYPDIINTKDDPFKKMIKLLMKIHNISKSELRKSADDDYTVNNLMTTVNSNKPLSAQLFSRFIRMGNFAYIVQIYENDKMIFEFKE